MKKVFLLIVTLFAGFAMYGQDTQRESFLVYNQSGYEESKLRIRDPIALYVTVENNAIIGFSLRDKIVDFINRNSVYLTFSSIELTVQDFNTLKSVFEKALEWYSIARHNDVASFSKKIPSSISSDTVAWDTGSDHEKHSIDLFNNELNSSVIIYQAANQSHAQ